MRAFISINTPKNIKEEIVKIQNSLPEFIGKKTENENLHLTLKFLGEIDEEKIEEIKKRLRKVKIKKFEAEIQEMGFFDNTKSKIFNPNLIVWLNMKNCEKLQAEIDLALKDLFKQEEKFMGHLTIARIKKIKNKKEFLEKLSKIKIKEKKFLVDKFYLMKSELNEKGPVYSVIEEFSF